MALVDDDGQPYSVLTRKRLAELIGGENALALMERYGRRQVPALTPRASEMMRRDIAIRRRLDRGESAADIARDLGLGPEYVVRLGKGMSSRQAAQRNERCVNKTDPPT